MFAAWGTTFSNIRNSEEKTGVLKKNNNLCSGNTEFYMPISLPRERRYSVGGWPYGSLAQATGLQLSVKRYRLKYDVNDAILGGLLSEQRTEQRITNFEGVRNLT